MQTERVISNLLGNAIKFTPKGGIVTLVLRRRANTMSLTVRDNGPGIDAAELPHIFDKYHRQGAGTAEGSGLGLFIVKAVVEARPPNRALLVGTPGVPAIHAFPALRALDLDELPHGGAHWLLDSWGDTELVTLTPGLGRYFGADKGVLVARAPDSAVFGLQDGDVILSIGGREPQSGSHAMRILRSYQPGEAVELKILRDRRTQTLAAKIPADSKRNVLRRMDAPKWTPAAPAPPPPAPPSAN